VTGWGVDGKIIQIKRTVSVLGTRVHSCMADTSAALAVYISLVYSESSTLSGIAYEKMKRWKEKQASVSAQMKIRFEGGETEKGKRPPNAGVLMIIGKKEGLPGSPPDRQAR